MSAEKRSARDLHDVVVNHIFATGLTLAGILSLHSVDAQVAERLHDAIHELDTAIHELRTAVLASRDADNELRLVALPDAPTPNRHRRLSHVANNAVFAYAAGGHDFYRAHDNELWAHESDDLLLSARSGAPLARRVGKMFHDIATNAPLYHEHAEPLTAVYED